jgi:hypothetical protein
MLMWLQKHPNSLEKLLKWSRQEADKLAVSCFGWYSHVGLLQETLYHVADSIWFKQGCLVTLVINVIALAVEHDGEPPAMELALKHINAVIVCAYGIEILVKV